MREIGSKGGKIGGKRSLETMTPRNVSARKEGCPGCREEAHRGTSGARTSSGEAQVTRARRTRDHCIAAELWRGTPEGRLSRAGHVNSLKKSRGLVVFRGTFDSFRPVAVECSKLEYRSSAFYSAVDPRSRGLRQGVKKEALDPATNREIERAYENVGVNTWSWINDNACTRR